MTEYYLAYEKQDEQETLVRITEQLIEKELLEYIEELKTTGKEEITAIKDAANKYIDEAETSVLSVKDDINGDIHFEEGDDVDSVIISAEDKGSLGENYMEAKQIYADTLDIAPTTEAKIEANIRQYMVDSGYSIGISSDDGNGNIVFGLVKDGE